MALTISPGQTLGFSGASVIAPAGTYWTLTVQAVDGGGNILGSAVQDGQGVETFNYAIGPLNASGGAQIGLRGRLDAYYDAAKTHPVNGSPFTASSGVIATVAQVASGPSAAPSLTGSVVQATAAFNWTSVAGATYFEMQPMQNGAPVNTNSLTAPGASSMTITTDPQGQVGYFVAASATSANWAGLSPGETVQFRVRGMTGVGPSALAGPWSNVLTLTVPNAVPQWKITGVQGFLTYWENTGYVEGTITNVGQGAGAPGYVSVGVDEGDQLTDKSYVGGVGSTNITQELAPGQSLTIQVPIPNFNFASAYSNSGPWIANMLQGVQPGYLFYAPGQEYVGNIDGASGASFGPVTVDFSTGRPTSALGRILLPGHVRSRGLVGRGVR